MAQTHLEVTIPSACQRQIYRVIQNDCRGFNNLSHTIPLRLDYMCFFI